MTTTDWTCLPIVLSMFDTTLHIDWKRLIRSASSHQSRTHNIDKAIVSHQPLAGLLFLSCSTTTADNRFSCDYIINMYNWLSNTTNNIYRLNGHRSTFTHIQITNIIITNLNGTESQSSPSFDNMRIDSHVSRRAAFFSCNKSMSLYTHSIGPRTRDDYWLGCESIDC
jgi:hypothetical protein